MGNPIQYLADKLKIPSLTDFILDNTVTPVVGPRDKNIDIGWWNALLTAVIPLGQLWGRASLLEGSMEKIWLMFPLFWMLPFSLIPTFFMYFGYFRKGKGGKPYDPYIFIPIWSKLLLAFFIPYLLNFLYLYIYSSEDSEEDTGPSDAAIFATTFIIQLVIGMIPNIIRTGDLCKDLTFNSFGKAFIDSTIANSAGELLPFIIGWLPYVGNALSVVEMIPFIGDQVINILWIIGFCVGYVFVNMVNADSMGSYCKSDFFGKDIYDTFGFLVMLCITIFVKVFNEISPF